jgi:hypothetical protein
VGLEEDEETMDYLVLKETRASLDRLVLKEKEANRFRFNFTLVRKFYIYSGYHREQKVRGDS